MQASSNYINMQVPSFNYSEPFQLSKISNDEGEDIFSEISRLLTKKDILSFSCVDKYSDLKMKKIVLSLLPNRFKLFSTDLFPVLCQWLSKKDLINNFSCVDKCIKQIMGKTVFFQMIPRELIFKGCNSKKLFMQLISSQEELLERINDLSSQVKPENKCDFKFHFYKKLSGKVDGEVDKTKQNIEFCKPAVEISTDSEIAKATRKATFFITNNKLLLSADVEKEINSYDQEIKYLFKYGHGESSLGYFENDMKKNLSVYLNDFSKIDTLIDSLNLEPRITQLAKDFIRFFLESNFMNKYCQEMFKNPEFNILEFLKLFSSKCVDGKIQDALFKNELMGMKEIIDNTLEGHPLINIFKSNHPDPHENIISILIKSLDAYTLSMFDEEFKIEHIPRILEEFNLEIYKKSFFEIKEKESKIIDSIFKTQSKILSLQMDNFYEKQRDKFFENQKPSSHYDTVVPLVVLLFMGVLLFQLYQDFQRYHDSFGIFNNPQL